MATVTRSALVLGLLVAAAGPPAAALEQPVSGKKLVVARRGSVEKLVFVSNDSAFLFPAVGSADDPGTGTPGGLLVEVLSSAESTAPLSAPPGAGNPGWKAKTGARSVHVFKNTAAPAGPSPLKRVVLREGRVLKVVSKSAGLLLAGPADRIAIRITTGSLRSCVVFDGAAARRNEANRFAAVNAPAAEIADCSDASLLGLPVPCGESGPTCGGACPAGEECASFGLAAPDNTCGCLPAGSTPCGTPGSPVCGGVCPDAQSCSSFFAPPSLGGSVYCNCADPGEECGNGFAWGGAPEEGFPFACYPVFCSGVYPTCGGPCGDGGTCAPFALDTAAFTGCICAAPGVCEPGGSGFDCPPGEVCHVGGDSTYPFCGAP